MAQAPEKPPSKTNPRQQQYSHPQQQQYNHPQHQPRASYYAMNRPNVKKAIHNFGVTDLREFLDKKHQEQDDTSKVPPPDPQYSYLKDPTREVYDNGGKGDLNVKFQRTRRFHNKDRNHYDNRVPPDNRPPYRGPAFHEGNSGNNRQRQFNNRPPHNQNTFRGPIQKPVNIRVELSTSTGEHKYTLDESTPLKQELKHVPDRTNFNRGPRQRGGPRKYYNNRGGYNRNRNNPKQEPKQNEVNEKQPTNDNDIEENWDDDLADEAQQPEGSNFVEEDEDDDYLEEANPLEDESPPTSSLPTETVDDSANVSEETFDKESDTSGNNLNIDEKVSNLDESKDENQTKVKETEAGAENNSDINEIQSCVNENKKNVVKIEETTDSIEKVANTEDEHKTTTQKPEEKPEEKPVQTS